MADTVTIGTDADTEHAPDVLTRDGTNRSEAIRRAVLDRIRANRSSGAIPLDPAD